MFSLAKLNHFFDNSPAKIVPRVMVDEDGTTFNKTELDKVVKAIIKSNYASGSTINVVSVVGAQNSGKSTLLNNTFGCNFGVMDASVGVNQTTKGLLVSGCKIPNLLIVDVEGCDGNERANQGNESFERKTALFALTFSHVMIFNMNYTDAGRNQGGCVPLFETIFQECVKLQEGRTKVIIALRRYDGQTPIEMLKNKMLDTLKTTWDKVNNPEGQENEIPFANYIQVRVAVFQDKVHKKHEYNTEVDKLRKWFALEAFTGMEKPNIEAAQFSFSAEKLWEQIVNNQQLDLPSHREMVCSHFCDELKQRFLDSLLSDETYLSLGSGMTKSTPEFMNRLDHIMKRLMHRYDEETKRYVEKVKEEKRTELTNEIIQITTSYCLNLINVVGQEIREEGTRRIYSTRNDNPMANVDELIESCVHKFNEKCIVLLPRYPSLPYDNLANGLRSELGRQAEIQLEHYRKYEELERARLRVAQEKEEAFKKVVLVEKQLAESKADAQRKKLETELAKANALKEKEEADRKMAEVLIRVAQSKGEADKKIHEAQLGMMKAEKEKEEAQRKTEEARRELAESKAEMAKMRLESELTRLQAIEKKASVDAERIKRETEEAKKRAQTPEVPTKSGVCSIV